MRRSWVEKMVVVAILAILVVMGIGWRSCAKRGGTYVRGAIWMVCVR